MCNANKSVQRCLKMLNVNSSQGVYLCFALSDTFCL